MFSPDVGDITKNIEKGKMNSEEMSHTKTLYQSAEVLIFTAFTHNKKGLTLIFYLFTLFLFFLTA